MSMQGTFQFQVRKPGKETEVLSVQTAWLDSIRQQAVGLIPQGAYKPLLFPPFTVFDILEGKQCKIASHCHREVVTVNALV